MAEEDMQFCYRMGNNDDNKRKEVHLVHAGLALFLYKTYAYVSAWVLIMTITVKRVTLNICLYVPFK